MKGLKRARAAQGMALLLGSFFVWLGLQSMAAAQTYVQNTGFRSSTVRDETLLRKGRMEFGIILAGAYSTSTITPEDGESYSQSSAYINPSLVLGYMLTNNIELRLSLGVQYLGSSVGDNVGQNTFSGVGAIQGLYQRDFVSGLAGYAGLGAGGYYGWRHVPQTTDPTLKFEYTHAGGLGQLLLGLLVQPSTRLMLRGGVRLDMLFGSESPAEESSSTTSSALDVSQSTFNTQIVAELGIGWRFN